MGVGEGPLQFDRFSLFNPLCCIRLSLLNHPAGGRVLERCWKTSQAQEELEVPAHGQGSGRGGGQGGRRQLSGSSFSTSGRSSQHIYLGRSTSRSWLGKWMSQWQRNQASLRKQIQSKRMEQPLLWCPSVRLSVCLSAVYFCHPFLTGLLVPL